MKDLWTRDEAIQLCRAIEDICPAYGCHVALTGGLLYRAGDRKDADILFYRIRQVEAIDGEGLFGALARIGVERTGSPGSSAPGSWVVKATLRGKPIDCFFPEVPPVATPSEEAASC